MVNSSTITKLIIPQVERFAGKYVFNKLTARVLNTAIDAMTTKSDNPTGNHYIFICNSRMWSAIQASLSGWIRDWKTVGTFMFSKEKNDYVKVGATFSSYEFAGNTVTFKVDRALDVEFPTRQYGVFLDLTADRASGKAAINMFTFKGGELIHNIIKGVGGENGLSSGEVASPVAGSKIINWGYAGVGVMNPYRSFILMSEK